MEFGSIDRYNEPDTDEFETLEFSPEQPEEPPVEHDDTSDIVFTTGSDLPPEPPVSFDSVEDADFSAGDDSIEPHPEFDFDASMPFELFGTSLFDDPDPHDELDSLDNDSLDDDLEF